MLSGFHEILLRDEMYFVRVDADSTTRLLETHSPDYGGSTAAWAHECRAGRAFCFTPGHRPEVLQDKAYRKLLAKGLLRVQRL
jgi:type 1 glutamine amidotransferase